MCYAARTVHHGMLDTCRVMRLKAEIPHLECVYRKRLTTLGAKFAESCSDHRPAVFGTVHGLSLERWR